MNPSQLYINIELLGKIDLHYIRLNHFHDIDRCSKPQSIYSLTDHQNDHNSSCLENLKFKHHIINLALAAKLASTFNKFRLCPDSIQIMGKQPVRSKNECDECTIGVYTIA